MADNNKSRLKFFVRVDGQGKDISGSGVWRAKTPKVGRWRQFSGYQCCDPYFSTSTTTSTTSTTTTSPSDIRLKSNIVFTGNMIGKLREYKWEWNSTAKALNLDGFRTIGVLAQEALDTYPDAVSIAEDGFYRVDYSKIV